MRPHCEGTDLRVIDLPMYIDSPQTRFKEVLMQVEDVFFYFRVDFHYFPAILFV